MPKYHFDVADGHVSCDIAGTDLRDNASAREHAVIFAGNYLADHPQLVESRREMRVVVRGAEGGTIFTVIVLTVSA